MLPALLLCSACGLITPNITGASPEPAVSATPLPSPTPTPAPTPVPVLTIVSDEAHALFAIGVKAAQGEAVFDVQIETGGLSALDTLRFTGRHAVLVYLDTDEADVSPLYAAAARGLNLYVYNPGGVVLEAEIPQLTAEGDGAQDVLAAALSYPPHDTPVRLFGAFSMHDSPAQQAWNTALAAGRIFVKSVYYHDDTEKSFADWYAGKLDSYYPGMVDAVFTETAADALDALDTLTLYDRGDMEIFCCESSDALIARMLAAPELLPCIWGADDYAAGALCMAQAERLLAGEPAESGTLARVLITPELLDSYSFTNEP